MVRHKQQNSERERLVNDRCRMVTHAPSFVLFLCSLPSRRARSLELRRWPLVSLISAMQHWHCACRDPHSCRLVGSNNINCNVCLLYVRLI